MSWTDDSASKEVESTKLVKLVTRAFYSDHHVAVVDAFLYTLRNQSENGRVREEDLTSQLHIGQKQIRELLGRLSVDNIIHRSDITTEIKTHPEYDIGKTIKGRELKKGHTKRENSALYFINPEHLVKVVQYRLVQMDASLNAKTGKQEQYYACTAVDCSDSGRRYDELDLIVSKQPNEDNFYCKVCRYAGRLSVVDLVINKDSENSSTDGMKRFNSQIDPIQTQLQRVINALRQETNQLDQDEKEEARPAPTARVDDKPAVKAETGVKRKVDDKLEVPVGEEKKVRAKKMKINNTSSRLAWDVPTEDDKDFGQETKEPEKEEEEEEDQEQSAELRKQIFDQEFERLSAVYSSKQEDLEEEEEEEEVDIWVGGVCVRCKPSSVGQDEIDRMTEQELEAYETIVESLQDPFDF